MNQTTVETHDPTETMDLGARLGAAAGPNTVFALSGPLGSGKTHLAKGLALGLGIADAREVTSPTYILINEYEGRLHVFHLDAYRLDHPGQLEALGFEDMCSAGGVVLVEWAERIRLLLPPDHLAIELTPTGPSSRRLSLTAHGPLAAEVLDSLTGNPDTHT